MNRMFKRLCLLPVALALGACAELNQLVADLQAPATQSQGTVTSAARAAETISESLTQICQAVQKNQVRTQALYENKRLMVRGVVSNIRDGYFPATLNHNDSYSVTVEAAQAARAQDRISVFARSNDEAGVSRLSKGQRVQTSGIVTRIQYMPLQGCWITLYDATFSG